MSHAVTLPAQDTSGVRRYWPSIVACFVTAVFGWGFGFTGTSVYLAELHQLHGWPNALIASAITEYYLLGALCLTRVHSVLRWLGPRGLLAMGLVLLGAGATLFSRSTQIWQLFAAAAVMAGGWASCTSTAISSSLALYFQKQRGLAITLALNGASAAGFTVAPLLLELSQHIGVGNAVPLVAAAMLAMVLPLVGLGFGRRAEQSARPDAAQARDAAAMRAPDVLRTWRFWSIALPFALVLAAQVGLIVHLVSFLLPRLGAASAATAVSLVSIAAMGGRLVLATVIDRLHQRRAAAISFASQAAGLGLMIGCSHQPEMLYAGCLLFGLSVGNVITFPALIVQREFPSAAFALVIGLSTAVSQFTFALAPVVLGVIRYVSGGYAAVLAGCMVLQLCGAALVLLGKAIDLSHGTIRHGGTIVR